ncbi:MAG TPA: SulP family inorganic anion transporter, partial [Thermoanaerobaculia bacterium]|nr:SulP family inorganic anion transporter [Thermoanaerobaculia bacterium]
GGDPRLYLSLSVTLSFLAGLISIGGRFLRLGALADFLSKPILVGFLNGVSISILLGQAGKVFGFPVKPGGIIPRIIDILGKLPATHLPTLAVGGATFLVLAVAPRILPAFPRNLVAMVAAAVLVALLGLDARGVAILGEVPRGLPRLALPDVPLELLPKLIADAAGLALVTFTSMMLTARSFASKNGYDVDADREFAALGAANVAAAISQSFAVSGADSRTAVSDAAGGKTQMTGLVAAAALSLVLLFFTGPLRYVPVPALGAVLILASVSLLDVRNLRLIWRVDRVDCLLSVFVTFGVVAVGAINAILVAVVVAVIRFVRIVSRPPTEVLGRVPGLPGFHGTRRHPDAETIPGVVLFRFNGPVVFFNAPHFKREALAAAEAAGPGLKWFVLDAIPIPLTDATGLYVIDEVSRELKKRGVVVVAAGRVTERREWRQKHGFTETDALAAGQFPTLESAVEACLAGRVAGSLA